MTNRRRIRVCREGGYYLLILAALFTVGILVGANLVLIWAALLAGPMLLGWRLALKNLRNLEVVRKLPRGVCAGDLLVVSLDVRNARAKAASWAVVVEDRVIREEGNGRARAVRPRAYFDHVPAGLSRRQTYEGRIPHRGKYRIGPLVISTRFPAGLFRGTVEVGDTEIITVYPRLGRLRAEWLFPHREAFQGSQRSRLRQSRASGDFYGVREWRPGDSRRWIHWRSSARHGVPVVRQFDQPGDHDVAVLVDLWQPRKPEVEDLENVELAVSFAATVIADACRRGGMSLLLAITDTEPDCVAGPVSTLLREEAMERLALAAASSEDRLAGLFKATAGQIGPQTDVILVSTRRVDPNEVKRFGELEDEAKWQAVCRRIRFVDTSQNDLAECFQPD